MHLLEQFHHLVGDGSSADVGVQPDRLRDLTADAHHRVQRPSGVLEDEADPLAADLRELAVSQSDEVRPSNRTVPDIFASSGRRPAMALAVIVLPDPDSPTSPNLVPRGRSSSSMWTISWSPM